MMSTAEEVKAAMFGDNPTHRSPRSWVGRYSPSLSATRSRWPDLTTPVSMMLDRSPVRSLQTPGARPLGHGRAIGFPRCPDVSPTSRCLC